jgi:UDP-N-acetylmuramoylalanine-D-glutamate ligase
MSLNLPKQSRNQRLFDWLLHSNSKQKRVLVMGGGASGKAAYELLTKLGLKVTGADDKGNQSHPLFVPTSSIHMQSTDFDFDLVVLSPGVPLSHPVVVKAQQTQTPVIGEVELGLAFIEDSTRIIGITGTNGKSTVTHCIGAILSEKLGTQCPAIGNIGSSVCNYVLSDVLNGRTAPALSLELSSYQLETMAFPNFDAAIFTNFSPDHLARYVELEAYFRAKWRLSHLLKASAPMALSLEFAAAAIRFGGCVAEYRRVFLILQDRDEETSSAFQKVQKVQNAQNVQNMHSSMVPPGAFTDDLRLPIAGYLFNQMNPASFVQAAKFETVRYSCESADRFTFSYQPRHEDQLGDQSEGNKIRATRSVSLQGSILQGVHNAQNLAFCRFTEIAFFHSEPTIISRLFSSETSHFKNLPHRQELVESPPSSGIKVINDSKSTSFICTSRALACFPKGTHLLLGGLIKDRDVEDILPDDGTPLEIRSVYTFGPEALWLAERAREILGAPASAFESMHTATQAALRAAKPGETVLLSPGAASFDSFTGFEDRGRQFTLEVQRFFANNGQ